MKDRKIAIWDAFWGGEKWHYYTYSIERIEPLNITIIIQTSWTVPTLEFVDTCGIKEMSGRGPVMYVIDQLRILYGRKAHHSLQMIKRGGEVHREGSQ